MTNNKTLLIIFFIALAVVIIMMFNYKNSNCVKIKTNLTNLTNSKDPTESIESLNSNESTKINELNKITLYYTNRCGHCKQFKPEWNIVKNKYKNTNKGLTFVEINCDENSSLCFNIQGLPFIMLELENNEKHEYTDYPRTAESLEKFLSYHLG